MGDITKQRDVREAVRGVDCVIHACGYVSIQTFPDTDRMNKINVVGEIRRMDFQTGNLLDILARQDFQSGTYAGYFLGQKGENVDVLRGSENHQNRVQYFGQGGPVEFRPQGEP